VVLFRPYAFNADPNMCTVHGDKRIDVFRTEEMIHVSGCPILYLSDEFAYTTTLLAYARIKYNEMYLSNDEPQRMHTMYTCIYRERTRFR